MEAVCQDEISKDSDVYRGASREEARSSSSSSLSKYQEMESCKHVFLSKCSPTTLHLSEKAPRVSKRLVSYGGSLWIASHRS
jgi:hypothetical protein